MSWPEAIFYSVLVVCGLVALVILIGIALLLSALSSTPRVPRPRSDDFPRLVSTDMPKYISIKYEGPEDKAPDMAELLREAKK